MNIIQIFPGKIWGGAEQFILDLGEAFQAQGNKVHYMSRNSDAIKSRTKGCIDLRILPFKGFFDIVTIYKLAEIIKAKNIDIIHIHDMMFVPMVCMAKKWSKSNVSVVVHRHIARASKTKPITRIYLKYAAKIIFVSELAKKLWLGANRWFPEEKCSVIINSIPENHSADIKNDNSQDIVSGSLLKQKFNIPQATPVLVFTGRVRKSKGCATIVEALEKIKHLPFHLVFIGACKPKDYIQTLQQKATEYGIADRISFYGFANNARELIKEADIGLAPSIVREACPLSPMEFMQAGKPVIASNNGAQPEYITHLKTGILISPNNSQELASAISGLLENGDLRNQIGKNAQKFFNTNLNYGNFIYKIMECYRNLRTFVVILCIFSIQLI